MHSVDPHKGQNTDRRERAISVVLLVLALVLAGGAVLKTGRAHQRLTVMAQADSDAPAQSAPQHVAPDQVRPTAPTPPADPKSPPARTTGSASPTKDQPVQPPAEKYGAPVEQK